MGLIVIVMIVMTILAWLPSSGEMMAIVDRHVRLIPVAVSGVRGMGLETKVELPQPQCQRE